MTYTANKRVHCQDMPEYKVGDYVKYGRDTARVIGVFTHPTAPTVYRILIVDGERVELNAVASDLVRDV